MNKKNYKNYLDSYIDSINDNIKNLKQSYPTDFDKVIDLILNSRGRLVFSGIGKSGQVAKKISSSITSTGTPSFFVHPSEAVHGDLGMIQNDDIVFAISNSGNTKELHGIIDYCKNRGIILVSITSNQDSHLAKNSDYKLFIPKVDEFSSLGSPCNSIILTLIIGDALMIALHNEKNFSKDKYRLFHPSGSIGKSMMRLEEIMIEDFPICTQESDATNILIDMSSKKFDFCVVVDSDKKFVGILEIDEIKEKINSCKAEYNIEKNVISTNKEALVFEIMEIIKKLGNANKKNIIVLDENKLVKGVITENIIEELKK